MKRRGAAAVNEMISSSQSHHSRLLDLFCGAGLAAWGYWASGRFTEIVGVDLNPAMKHQYAFDFIHADALSLDYEFLMQFDFIHASPPCQAYSYLTPKEAKANHPRLILPVKRMLHAAGVPHVVENVLGSLLELRPNAEMNGAYFGLDHDRPRYFYVSDLGAPVRWIKSVSGAEVINGKKFISRDRAIKAMGLDQMISRSRLKKITKRGIEEGIPPAFTRAIAETVIPCKAMIA